MRTHTRLLLVGLAASILLAAAASSVSANRLSLRARFSTFRMIWNSLEFSNTAGEGVVRCPATLEGSFHSATIEKVRGALIGHVTRAALGACEGGQAAAVQGSLPWHLQYESFRGTLPNITLVNLLLIRASFQITESELTCTGTTEAGAPARLRWTVRESLKFESVAFDETLRITLHGGIFCEFISGMLAGSSGVPVVLGTSTQLSIKLI